VSNAYWTLNNFPKNIFPKYVEELDRNVTTYIDKFLCSPHPHRKGAVCPFVKPALNKNNIHLTYYPNPEALKNLSQSKDFLEGVLNHYVNNIQKDNHFGAVVVLFPADFDSELLCDIQLFIKEVYVNKYTMIGALFPKSDAPSLHSNDYFPLRTPIPTLVIRDLVPTDLQFLIQNSVNLDKKNHF
jgi:hypothetical protein